MNKVAIYARVSTVENQEYERQINDLTKVIKYHGYKDNQIEIFAEKLSGYNKERPELKKLINNASNYKCIYVSEISRLGRNPSHTRKIIDELIDKNIPIYIQSIGQSTIDSDGKRNGIMSIILQVLMEFADQEAQTMKIRMASGKLQAVKDGIVSTSTPAYGYKNVDKQLTIDDDESEVVKMIFKLAKDGYGTRTIANKLNQLNIPTRRNKTLKGKGYKVKNTDVKSDASNIEWGDVTVRQIIKNPIYYGKRIYKGELFNAPAIIKEELYIEVNEAITDRTTKGDAIYTYLLKNLMICGVCGRKYYGKYQPTSKASKKYECTSRIKGHNCGNSAPHLFYLESIFYNMFLSTDITQYIENPNDIKATLESDIDKLNNEIEAIKSEKSKKTEEQNRLIQLFTIGSFDLDKLNEMNEGITKEIKIIDDKLSLQKDKLIELKISLSNYDEETTSNEMLINAKENRQELRNIFKQLIDKVIVNKINDTYTLLTFYAKVKGVSIKNPLKIFIDTKATRKNPHTGDKTFKYLTTLSLKNDPIFNDEFILQNSIKDIEIELKEMVQIANNQSQTKTKLPYQFEYVPKENYLYINEKLDH